MKTIFHANIDGREIVLGFGEAFGLIDPVATAVKIGPLLGAADETKQMTALNSRINAVRQQAMQAFGLAEGARQRGDAPTMVRQNGEYQAKLLELGDLEKQLEPVVRAFEARRAAITEANAVYAHPPQGETLIDDAQAADMAGKHALRGDGRALGLDGKYVTDLRGRDFYLAGPPWRHMVIDALGEDMPSGALMSDQLTDAQRAQIAEEAETARVAALSPEDRATEVQRVTASALTQAAQKRSELEISGAKDALAQSQAAYADAVEAIAAKYGT